MEASIIIPTKDKLSRLRLILKALEDQMNSSREVILVFDGCQQKTLKAFDKLSFSFAPVKIISKNNVGRAAARNLGIRVAKGKIIIFLDDDRIPAPDFVSRHIAEHHEPCAVIGGRFDILLTEEKINDLYLSNTLMKEIPMMYKLAKREGYMKIGAASHSPLRWLNFFTGNLSVKKEDLEKSGLFDEAFVRWGHEDLDLGIRLYQKGVPFKVKHDIINLHLAHPSNFAKEKHMDSLQNIKYLLKKYKQAPMVYWVLIMLYLKSQCVGIAKPNFYKSHKNKKFQ